MDILSAIRNDIEMLRGRVPMLSTEEAIWAVERIRNLEGMVGDVIAARQQAAMLSGATPTTIPVVIAGPVARPAWCPPVRQAVPAATPQPRLSRGLSVVPPGDEVAGSMPPVSRWAAQRARCYAALVGVYAALVESREDSLDYY